MTPLQPELPVEIVGIVLCVVLADELWMKAMPLLCDLCGSSVMDVESFFPAKERFSLAMSINALTRGRGGQGLL